VLILFPFHIFAGFPQISAFWVPTTANRDHHSSCSTFGWILNQIEKLIATNIYMASDKYEICRGNIYGHPKVWCEDQHRLITKKFFYLELKRNRQFYKLSAEQITIRLPAPPVTNGNNYQSRLNISKRTEHTPRFCIQFLKCMSVGTGCCITMCLEVIFHMV
jgi:hypothetical protein